MKNLRYLLPLFALMLIFGNCGEDDDSADCTGASNYPYLEVGNKWTYDFEDWLGGSAVVDIEIVEDLGDNHFRVDYTTSSPSSFFPDEITWYSCGDYIATLSDENAEPTDNIFSYRNPDLGFSWQGFYNNEEANYEVIAKNVSVSTQAGTFVCNVMTFNVTGAFNVDTIYESPDVGVVKYTGVVWEYELREKNF